MQSILVSGARLIRSVSGCLVRDALASKLRWCKFVGEEAKGTTSDMLNLTEARRELKVVPGSGPETVTAALTYCEEARQALLRKVQEENKYLLTIKSEKEMRMAFHRWAAEYGIVYPSVEEKEKRFSIFAEAVKSITESYSRNPKNSMALTWLSDRRISEVPMGAMSEGIIPFLQKYKEEKVTFG